MMLVVKNKDNNLQVLQCCSDTKYVIKNVEHGTYVYCAKCGKELWYEKRNIS